MKATGHETLWVKVGDAKDLTVMAKTVLMFGRGCFLEFINLNNGEEHHLTLNNHKENGDGVQCFRGHSSLLLFAYSESCQDPILYVKSYPDFHLIAKFQGERAGYKCLAFSDSSLLFSLGEKPDYKVTAWNWRSTVKFAESKNELLYEDQIIRCSYGRPMYLAQLGKGSRKLFIWDVFTVCKTSIFAKHELHIGKLTPGNFENVVWAMDSLTLYIIDDRGCIYTVDRDFYLVLVVDITITDLPGPVTPSICWFHHGLSVSGPNKEIRHYKKVGSTWLCDSSYPTEMVVKGIISGKPDKCLGFTDIGEIVSFGHTADSVGWVRRGYSNYTELSMIHPKGEFIVAKRGRRELDVFEVATGRKVSTIAVENSITSMTEHPLYPFMALGTAIGSVQLVSFYNETKPTSLTEMLITDQRVTCVRFFENGNLLVAGNFNRGEYYILRGLPGTQIEVLLQISVGLQTTDYMLVASQNMMRFFVIPVTQTEHFAGDKVIRYCIVDKKIVNVKTYTFETDQMYRRFLTRKGPDRDRVFYLLPFAKRHIALVETKRGSPTINVIESIKTGHLIKRFLYKADLRHVVTYAFDGFTFIRSADLQTIEGMALNHHRYWQGVKSGLCNPSAAVIITLGFEGNLVAVRLAGKEDDETLAKRLREQHDSPKVALMFRRPTFGFPIEERFIGKSWKEIQRLKTIEEEQRQCEVEKNKILREFQDIQNILQQLVSDNIEAPDNKKLDLMEFYLDAQSYQKMQQTNKEECKELEVYLKHLILAQDKVSEYIINQYYKPMGVQWENIMGIFSAQKATNYCLLPEDPLKEKKLGWIEEQRKIEYYLGSQDTFEPWKPMTKQQVQDLMAKKPVAPKEDYTGIANLITYKEGSDEFDHETYLETKVAFTGTVSQLYIEVFPGRYKQRQINSFYQTSLQQAVAEREVTTLKKSYNKCFQNTRAVKEREMYNIKEKNARLRQIISEYNYFSEKKVNIDIVDPEWQDIENPETSILRVSENEIPVRPYVSPSEQAILDAKAAEEERLRLLLLADDFKERALMAMMNGVLEIRWEDELKKDVPKPKFMLEKNPEEYNEEDLRGLREYEEKVAQLNTEREKYKSLLEVEFGKLATSLRESIRKFNLKLYECTKYKFYIDSGMNQENLIINRQRWIQHKRIEIDLKAADIIHSIKVTEVKLEENQKIISRIIEALAECRVNLETMQTREKQLEKVYRKEFQDISPVVQEQAYKFYKKRPKYNYKVIGTATVLNELAKGVATDEISRGMTQECLDYMKALEALDSSVGLPPTMDEASWNLVCKHRRLRIEYEIRLRAAQIQILEGEATITTFQKRVSMKKDKIGMLNEELERTREDRIKLIHNKEIQIVLRRGLVEIPMTGELYVDFVDAILVPKSEIERVNNLINEAGTVKLKTIQQNMKFKRRMMATEWEHTKLRMTINDFIEQKKDIENVKFTKEMQNYLKNKTLGRKPESESYEMEVELLAIAYENRIRDKKEKLKKIDHQLKTFRESNKQLDHVIREVNIDLCHYKLEKDYEVETKERDILQTRMDGMLERNMLVQKIQQNHNDILVLQTELELLRLRTFPTFKYKILDE